MKTTALQDRTYPTVKAVNGGLILPVLLAGSTKAIDGRGNGKRYTPEGKLGYGITAYMAEIVILPNEVWIQGQYFTDDQVNPSLFAGITDRNVTA